MHRGVGQIAHLGDLGQGANQALLAATDQKATGAGGHGGAHTLHHRLQRNVLHLKLLRIQQHLKLLFIAAVDRDLGHARHRQDRLAVGAQHQLLQIHERGGAIAFQREGHLQDRAEWGNKRGEFGSSGIGRQLGAHLLHPLRHRLTGAIDVGALLKHHLHHRQTRLGGGAHRLHPGDTVHGRFDRQGDPHLHLLRGEPVGAGLHIHLGRGKRREHIQRHLTHGQHTPEADDDRSGNDQPAAGDRKAQGGVEQPLKHPSACGGSAK